jgi:hypothetical protein
MVDAATQHERLIARRAKPMELALLRWMQKRAREEAAEAIKSLRQSKASGRWVIGKALSSIVEVAKDRTDDRELLEILMRFGVAQAKSGSMRITTERDIDRIIDPKRLASVLESKEFKLKVFTVLNGWETKRARQISADTKRMVTDSIMRILREAASEQPQPSAGEMARRIRTQFHGEDPKGRIYAWSPERAAVIARTELAQAENTGAMQGYAAAGVKRIRWLAKTDGRSGERHHERMHGKEIDIGESFTLPSGVQLRYPGDPAGDISEVVNCRCACRSVILPSNRSKAT